MENNKTYKPLLIDSIKASVDLEKQRFVGFDGNYCQAGKKALGVIDAETEKEQFAPVAINGILLVVCGGIVNAFDRCCFLLKDRYIGSVGFIGFVDANK